MTRVQHTGRRCSYGQFQAMPDDGRRYELIAGDLFALGSGTLDHQLVLGEIAAAFYDVLMAGQRGLVLMAPFEVKLAGDNSVQPDVLVVLPDRRQVITAPRIDGAPSILAEIVSPESQTHDHITKVKLYAENGVPEYWLVDLASESITVYILQNGTYVPIPGHDVARSHVVPEVTVNVRALFGVLRKLPSRQ